MQKPWMIPRLFYVQNKLSPKRGNDMMSVDDDGCRLRFLLGNRTDGHPVRTLRVGLGFPVRRAAGGERKVKTVGQLGIVGIPLTRPIIPVAVVGLEALAVEIVAVTSIGGREENRFAVDL